MKKSDRLCTKCRAIDETVPRFFLRRLDLLQDEEEAEGDFGFDSGGNNSLEKLLSEQNDAGEEERNSNPTKKRCCD